MLDVKWVVKMSKRARRVILERQNSETTRIALELSMIESSSEEAELYIDSDFSPLKVDHTYSKGSRLAEILNSERFKTKSFSQIMDLILITQLQSH